MPISYPKLAFGTPWKNTPAASSTAFFDSCWVSDDPVVAGVAVGAAGQVKISTDGVAWGNSAWAGGTPNVLLSGVCWVPGATPFFLIVGADGFMAKLDPTVGGCVTLDSGSETTLVKCASTGARTLVIGEDNTVLVSDDQCETWTESTHTLPDQLNAIIADGSFLAVGNGGLIARTGNGVNWTTAVSGVTDKILDVVRSNSLYVAVGEKGLVLTSVDGLTWVKRESGTKQTLYGVSCSDTGQFTAVGEFGIIRQSDDGIVWRGYSSGTTQTLNTALYVMSDVVVVPPDPLPDPYIPPEPIKHKFVVFGDKGVSVQAPEDPEKPWGLELDGDNLFHVLKTDTHFIAVGDRGKIKRSENGSDWETIESATEFALLSAAKSDTLIVAVGESGITLISENGGVTWQNGASDTNQTLNCVMWDGEKFVAVGEKGIIRTSTNGLKWVNRQSGNPLAIKSIAGSGNQYAAIGQNGTIITSTNASTWMDRASGVLDVLHHVSWSGSQFLAVGEQGTILTSPDAITWTKRTSGTTEPLRWGGWFDYRFVVLGGNGKILTSLDGITWTSENSGITQTLLGAEWKDGNMLIIGGRGAVLTA